MENIWKIYLINFLKYKKEKYLEKKIIKYKNNRRKINIFLLLL